MAQPRAAQAQTTNRITGSRRWWALGAVMLTMFFASLDQTVVSTALPVIVGDLKGLSIYAWVFTAYMMGAAVTVPIYGKLSDIYGRKPFYVFGLLIFMAGSALSGQAHSMVQLIAFRALQGIGAGAMMSMPRATIGDIFNPRERGNWMGFISMTFGLASIIGPFLGGWITDNIGWRWIFYINLPVAAAALLAIVYALPTVRVDHQVHIDWLGSILLVLGILPMLLGFTWAGSKYAWGSTQILGLFAFSAVMIVLFIWAERRAKEPIIPMQFFKVPIFAVANVVALLLTVGMFGTLMFLPIYVQGVLGMSAQNSGVIMTPMMLSFITGAVVAGQLMSRTGRYKVAAMAGALLMVIGIFLFMQLTASSTWPDVVRDMLVLGIGIGSLMPILGTSVQNAFPYRSMGVVNAAQQFVRSLAGVIAAPILGAVLANGFGRAMATNIPGPLKAIVQKLPAAQRQVFSDPQSLINAQTQAAIQSRFAAFGAQGASLYHQFIHAVRVSLAGGIHDLFVITLLFAIGAFLATLALPEIVLKHDEFFGEPEQANLLGETVKTNTLLASGAILLLRRKRRRKETSTANRSSGSYPF